MESLRFWRLAMGLTVYDMQERVPKTANGNLIPENQWYRAEKRGVIPRKTALERYRGALNVTYSELYGMQAVIEEYIQREGAASDANAEAIMEIYAKRLGKPVTACLPTRPGPILNER